MIHVGWVWICVPAVAQRLSCQAVYENMEMGFACSRVVPLKQRYDLGPGLIPDEPKSTSR